MGTIVEVDVLPYTHSGPIAKKAMEVEGKKPIKSPKEEKKTTLPLVKPFGLDLDVSLMTEEEDFEITRVLKDLKASALSMLAGSPVPSHASRRTSFKVTLNPRDSECKEADLYLTIGASSKRSKKDEQRVYLVKESKAAELEKICSEYAPENKEECKRQIEKEIETVEPEVKQLCQERKEKQKQKFQQQLESKQQCQQQQQMVRQQQQQQKLDEEEKKCKTERQLIKAEKNLCIKKFKSEGLNTAAAEKKCEKKVILSEKRHETRQQLKRVLRDVEEGKAVSASGKLVLSGTKSRIIEGSVTIGEKTPKLGEEETKVEMRMNIETPELGEPIESYITANGQIRRPTSEWEKEEILKSDLTSKVLVDGHFKYGEEKRSIRSTIVAYRSDEQKKFVEESEEWNTCSEDEKEGRKLSSSCRTARNMASSLDKVNAKLSLPKEISENRFVEMVTEACKLFFLPYSSQRYTESKPTGPMREYEVEAEVDGRGRYLSVKAKGNGEDIRVRDFPLRWDTREFLPICTKESFGHKVIQKLTRHSAPSTCKVEPTEITTFDGKNYRYAINDCEHVVFAEESSSPRVVVSNKKTQKMHVISMIVDGEKYIVEIPRENRHARREQVTLKINGQEKQVQEIKKVQREEMKETHVTKHEDGVYSIHSYKYGVEVLCDGERLMVRTNELVFRNRATGLCGDLNGEETADLKTGRQCVLSESELTGLRFMLEDGKCHGIPEEKKTQIEREEGRCVKEEVEPTIVSGIVSPKRSTPTERVHLVEKYGGKTCFSKNMIRSCTKSTPKEVRARTVGYVCMTGAEAKV